MSVVDVETNEDMEETKPEKGTFLCQDCHSDVQTSMNIGLPKNGYCSRCGKLKKLYMVF